MRGSSRSSSVVVGVLTAGLVLGACSGPAATRSGVAAVAPAVLMLASNDQTLPPGVQHFAYRVAAESGGTVRVEVAPDWKDGPGEAEVLTSVIAGEADLGWSGSRALDQIGVRSLTPLLSPFLIGSYAAQRAVVSDPQIVGLLTALRPVGLEGLALLPGELRVPVGISGPLREPADYRGARIRSYPSDIQFESLSALGATPTTKPVDEPFEPDLDGVETMPSTLVHNGHYTPARLPTMNTPLWPRIDLIVANPASLQRLTDEQRGWVLKAARDAAEWSKENVSGEVSWEMEELCQQGVRVVTADAEQVAALREAVRPVLDRIRADPELAPTLARIEEIVSSVTPEELAIPAGCTHGEGDAPAATPTTGAVSPSASGRVGQLPNGVYRLTISDEQLRSAGMSPDFIRENAGIWTWILEPGRWSFSIQPDHQTDLGLTTCDGSYDVSGSAATFRVRTAQQAGTCAPPTWTATWKLQGDTLVWSDTSISNFAPVFAGDPWTRIA